MAENNNSTGYRWAIGLIMMVLLFFVGSMVNSANSQMGKLEEDKVSEDVYLVDKGYFRDRLDRMDKKLDKLLERLP